MEGFVNVVTFLPTYVTGQWKMGALVNQLMIYCCCCNEEIKSQILFMLGSAPCWYLIFRYDKVDEREVSISFDVDLTF